MTVEQKAKKRADKYRESDEYSSSEPYDNGYADGLEIGFTDGYHECQKDLTELLKDLYLMCKVEHLEARYESVEELKQYLGETE